MDRLLLLTPDYPPARGGIQALLHQLVGHLQGFDVTVVTLAAQGSGDFDARRRERVVRVPGPRRLPHAVNVGLLNAAALAVAVRRRPDVILSGHIVTSPAALTVGRALDRPVVQYLYGKEMAGRPRLAAAAVRYSDASVAISHHTTELARASRPSRGRIELIPPGVAVSAGHGMEPFDRPTIVTVARLGDRHKGHDVVLEALGIARASVPELRWLVIGDGPLRPELERRAGELGVAGHVEFLGSVGDEERDRLVERAHAFVMPSRVPADGGGEGFGIVYLEAGARGVPSIAGNRGGAVDAVLDGQTGLLIDATSPPALARAIVRLTTDRALRDRLGAGARTHAQAHDWPLIARRVEALLHRVMERS